MKIEVKVESSKQMIGGFDADSKKHKFFDTWTLFEECQMNGRERVLLKQPLSFFSHHPLEGVIFFVLL